MTITEYTKHRLIAEYDEYGYKIQVFAGESLIYSYTAGNHRMDSAASAAIGSPEALPIETLRAYCEQTADEVATEYKVSDYEICHTDEQ